MPQALRILDVRPYEQWRKISVEKCGQRSWRSRFAPRLTYADLSVIGYHEHKKAVFLVPGRSWIPWRPLKASGVDPSENALDTHTAVNPRKY